MPPLAGNPRVQDEAYVVKVVREGLSGPLEVGGVTYDGVMLQCPMCLRLRPGPSLSI